MSDAPERDAPADDAGDEIPSSAQLRDGEVQPQRRALRDILDGLPTDPGVYVMRDRRNKVLYIGKAANLRARVRQYFQPNTGDTRQFVPLLEGVVADIETVVTRNEKEALLLENTLIKRHQPRFNVNLRDDKTYLSLRLDPNAEWPRLEVVRRIKDDGANYFGPYHSATSAREALRVVNRHFQLRTCTDHVLHNRRRPCLQHQIKRCPGPCVLPVSRDDYGEQVRDVRLFLEGKSGELLDRLRGRMRQASQELAFERAALVRDQLRALESTLEAQRVVSTDLVDQDVIGFYREGIALDVVVVQIREGKMVGSRPFSFSGQEFPDDELLSTFLGLYYDLNPLPPDEVLLPFAISDMDLKAEWLTELRQDRSGGARARKAVVCVPQRGPRRQLVDLANKNAAATFATRRNAQQDAEATLARLQRRLKLPAMPRVIECYDISHVQGTETVASQVVFVDGRPDKSRYRTYKLRHLAGRAGSPDDFASMYEVLSRRLRRAREELAARSDADDSEPGSWALPDLIVVDGGKGQLGMALAAARDVGIDTRWGIGLPIIALAKERESEAEAPPPDVDADAKRPDRVFLPHAKDPIAIRPNTAEMFVLQHLRDEAHRFAVTFHRAQRKRRTLRSALGDIAGIGATRQRALLRHFGSLKKIRDASIEELASVAGMSRKAAESVYQTLAEAAPAPDPANAAASPGTSAEAEQDAVESAFAELADDADPVADAVDAPADGDQPG